MASSISKPGAAGSQDELLRGSSPDRKTSFIAGRASTCHPACLRLPMLPAVGLALLPKCPLCWMAYLGLVTGVTVAPTIQWGILTLLAAALITLLTVLVRRRALGGWPLAAALLGGAIMLVGRLGCDSPVAVYVGLGILTMALIWNIIHSGECATAGSDCRLACGDWRRPRTSTSSTRSSEWTRSPG
jgi:hypothetical protein